jgi:hypothetical protein
LYPATIVFNRYELPSGGKEVSDLYLWKDMINAAREMLYTGVGAYTLWNGKEKDIHFFKNFLIVFLYKKGRQIMYTVW